MFAVIQERPVVVQRILGQSQGRQGRQRGRQQGRSSKKQEGWVFCFGAREREWQLPMTTCGGKQEWENRLG